MDLAFWKMSSKQHKVYLKLGELMVEESLNHNGYNKTICLDQGMVQYLLALACESIPSDDKVLIQSKMECIYDGCSAKIQFEVNSAILGLPKPSLPKPSLLDQPLPSSPKQVMVPAMASKLNEDEAKAKASVEACKVTSFQETSWKKVILRPSAKKMIWDNVIDPLNNHKMKLPGILPGWLLYGCSSTGKSTLVKAIMTECKNSGVTYYIVNCAEIFSPWMGMSVKFVKELFCQAYASGLALIVFDECDVLFKYEF